MRLITLFTFTAILSAFGSDLDRGFQSPPPSARPWVYWYFMDGNMTREGITADLEAMRDAGIGGAIFLEVNLGIPRGPVEFMSGEWQKLFSHAANEATRLGIELVLGSGPGWCGTGGPWVPPGQSMQHLVASETNVIGPAHFEGVLVRPPPRTPFFGEGTLTPALAEQWRTSYWDVAVLAFPRPKGDARIPDIDEKALYKRAPYSSVPGVKSSLATVAKYPEVASSNCVGKARVIDITARMSSDGKLNWDVPEGEWTILRFVRTPTGQTTRPAPAPGLGFETDKFDAAAVDAHLEHFVGTLLKNSPRSKGKGGGLSTLHFDSWEMSSQNWSARFAEEFRSRRGYDPTPFLPAYTGRVVESAEITERFLWDVRQTAQELVIANHVSRLRNFAHKHGLQFSSEPYDMNPTADLSLGAVADVPMCEFWWLGFDTAYSVIEAASTAHTCGRPIVAAEAFTSNPGEAWRAYPENMKDLGDWAFAAGVNRLAFHRYQHQPWLDRMPGMGMGPYGVHWERTQTWWPMASAYHKYLSRCQFLLRQGTSVADILFLNPEGSPHVFRPPPSATTGDLPDRRGYNFDGCAPETLMTKARVKHGKIQFPGGTTYQLLVLPEVETMTPGLLRCIEHLVNQGALVVGPPPRRTPGLSGYPDCDTEVQEIAQKLWAQGRGKKSVIWGQEFGSANEAKSHAAAYPEYDCLARLLRNAESHPDFESSFPVRYTHRRVGAAEIYFVANKTSESITGPCRFRVSGKQPELWHPVTGEIRTLQNYNSEAGVTMVPLQFEPGESFFIVFREKAHKNRAVVPNFASEKPLMELTGPWDVDFDPKYGGPGVVQFSRLEDWTMRAEPEIKYYSGRGVYSKTFDYGGSTSARTFIELGKVNNMARVILNGRELGVVWCAPWRVEVTGALKKGANRLSIEVANLWINRLIRDSGLPEPQRLTWTTGNPYKPDSKLSPSGLLGPVRLMSR